MKKKVLLLLMLWVALTTFAAPKMSQSVEFQFDADDALKMEQVKAETTLAIENGKLAPTRSWTDQNGTQWNAYILNQGGLWSMVGDGSYTVEDFPTYLVSVYITTQKPDGLGYNNRYILDLCWPAAVYWYEDDARESLGDAMWDISPLEWFDDQTVFTMIDEGYVNLIGILHPNTVGTTCMYNGTDGYTFDTSTTISFANYDAELSWLDINLSGKLVGRGTPNVAMAYSGETSLLGMVPGVEHEVEVGEVHIFDCGDIDYENDWAFVYTEEFEPVRRYQVCFSSTDYAYINPETGLPYNDCYTSDLLPQGPGTCINKDGEYFSFWGTFFAAEGSEKPYGQWTGPEWWKQDAWGVFTTPEAYKLILGGYSGRDISEQDGTWVVYDGFYRSPVQDSANMIIGDKNAGMDFTWTDQFGEKWHAAYKGDIFFHNDPTDFLKFEMIPAEGITLAQSINLNKSQLDLSKGESVSLIATVLPENTTDKTVTWTSSNLAVATVDANGLVTAIAVGDATITATTADGSNLSASCKIIVKPTLATSITLDYSEYEIVEKSDFQLVATVLPELTTNKGVVWSSSDMWVASVDENGLVRAYSVGEAVITATTIDGSNLSASCKVTVVSSLAQSITLDKTEVSLKATETATLVATVLPETTSNKSVEWTSSNEAVATVNNKGEVTAIAVGEVTITATTADGSNLTASCKVTVVPTLAESITLDKTEISLEATETATLLVTVLPELATDKSVKWSSSNEAVAIVDANGLVTAIAVGEATITAATVDDSNLSATCKVTVIPTLAVSIELDQTEASVEEKSDLQLTATILPEHATNKEVAWSSSDKWVATVDNTGLVTIHSAGEVIITATTTDGTNLSATCRINVYSGIDGVNGNDVIVATIGDNIVVKNAKLGSNVRVYAADGSIITSEIATDGDVVVEVPAKGIYVVAIDGKSFKVMVK